MINIITILDCYFIWLSNIPVREYKNTDVDQIHILFENKKKSGIYLFLKKKNTKRDVQNFKMCPASINKVGPSNIGVH
jgi:hypothetical protein